MDERTNVTKEATERTMGLSVIVFMQAAPSGELHGLRGAANRFLCLHQQTQHVLLAVVHARKTADWMSSDLQ
jgi:hypothetical protein